MKIEQIDSPISVGKRLRRLRLMAALSAIELAKLAAVGTTSISVWENGVYSMTERSADKVLGALQKKGVVCTKEWLLTGIGLDPQIIFNKHDSILTSKSYQLPEEESGQVFPKAITVLDEEIKLFAHSSEYAVIIKVEHDGMMPFISKGDVAGGIWQPVGQIHFNNEVISIVEVNGKLDIRNVKNGTQEGLFNISYISYNPNISMPFNMQDLPLPKIAPLKRLWRL